MIMIIVISQSKLIAMRWLMDMAHKLRKCYSNISQIRCSGELPCSTIATR